MLDAYADALPSVREAFDACALPYLYLSPLSVLPRVKLGKMVLDVRDEFILLTDGQGVARLLPTVADRQRYYQNLLGVLDQGIPLMMVPSYIARHVKGTYMVAPTHKEYEATTDTLADLPGGRLARVRAYANRWERACQVVELGEAPELTGAFIDCNTLWYRQQTQLGGKFRLYDKVVIQWLLENWPLVRAVEPTAIALGAIKCNRVVGVNISCQLSASWWGCYTRRHDMEENNVAMFLFREVARRFRAAGLARLSDGTADTKELRQMKDRYATPSITSFKAAKRARK